VTSAPSPRHLTSAQGNQQQLLPVAEKRPLLSSINNWRKGTKILHISEGQHTQQGLDFRHPLLKTILC